MIILLVLLAGYYAGVLGATLGCFVLYGYIMNTSMPHI